ncbi:MAG: glucoamylase family protein [Burkholderiaceae bacterium]|nr:glucoamylase family protein [Burkholderiaceae bacterium]
MPDFAPFRLFQNHSTRQWWRGLRLSWRRVDEDEPLRAALFSADQMALHGKRLAAVHVLSTTRMPDRLLARLAANEAVLVGICELLASTVAAQLRITPAAEWLLDNFYLIEEEIRIARRHLPRGYSRELPRLARDAVNGVSGGLPRVYDLALEVISHGDGRVTRGTLSRFVAAYQSVQPLLLGELWAIPIMLRLALIENLRRVAARVAAGREERDRATAWADEMLAVAEKSPTDLILVIADMVRSKPPMTSAFVAEFVRRLQGRGAALAMPLTWMEQRLAESGQTIERSVHAEGQGQAASQVSVSNSIASLRLLGAVDWREFVETLSDVEQTLRTDPAGAYAKMDFGTRDQYRHAVERIARLGHWSENEVARHAVILASAAGVAAAVAPDARRAHVGFYLIGPGRAALEQAAGVRLPPLLVAQRRARRTPLLLYGGAVGLGTLALAAGPLREIDAALGWPWWELLPIAALLALAASQLALALVNWAATLLVTPEPLPRMDFSSGIAPGSRTLVVVPTMLSSARRLDELVEALEVRYLANRDARLHFGLLTDFLDAAEEHLAGDAALVTAAGVKIAALNATYAAPADANQGDIFFLFHRPRRWNTRERVWMGHERKRGKLADLNALLRGKAHAGPGQAFSHIVGDTRALTDVRYVITLDTDTQLPRDAAAQFVATMAHPLNRPRFGSRDDSPTVTEGYGILQPRVGVSLPGSNRSGYARLCGGEAGIDPYTRAVSDVYQDAFGEGSFIGKGIYDIDAFERALGDRLPENRILSHDLLEGCYARSGLLSDVQLVEDPPARYSADVARRHRWIRGDWQLLGWLRRDLHELPSRSRGQRAPRNPLSALSQWKIFDNLRRSLSPAALVALLLLAWMLLPQPGLWTLRALAIVALVPLAAYAVALAHRALDRLYAHDPAHTALPAWRQALQVLLVLACLPYEVAYSLDAIARTLWRVLLSRRRLLQWQPSADVVQAAEAGSLHDLAATARTMWIGPFLAAGTAVALALQRPQALAGAGPLLLLWLLSPALVWWLDRPLRRDQAALSGAQTIFLRRLARRTWAFFETYVGPDDHHLPPDNMQEQPVARVAHRTSPTNMGFALLANLAARDFGYISSGELLARTTAALQTMAGLEKYRGHFYNWYDTQSLQPLRPHYVSSVDSGNLAGYLLTLRAGLLALPDAPVLVPHWCDGVRDTLGLLQEALGDGAARLADASLLRFEQRLETDRAAPPTTLETAWSMLDAHSRGASALLAALTTAEAAANAEAATTTIGEARRWAEALARQCRAGLDDIELLAPWASRPDTPGGHRASLPSLRELAMNTAEAGPAIEARAEARARLAAILDLATRVGALAEMDQSFLYDSARHLMSIGYNADERRLDPGYYDLLASEARLGSFVAIAQGQAGQQSWFALGRLLTTAGGAPVLLSWSGSMFEYLMPMLVMPSYEGTLLDQSARAAVQRQIEYGRQHDVPWGISESGYNATDTALNYQYRAFGVPGLGLKRGLAEDLVVAPYAAAMALMVAPAAACANLQRLAVDGAAGTFGLHEAIDYTPARLPRGRSSVVVRSFMAHHQGMSLLALAYHLLGQPMQGRFAADPLLQATLLLLHERVPRGGRFHPHTADRADLRSTLDAPETPIRVIDTPDTPAPEIQLLSNGRYHVMVSHAGGGYSRWKDLALTRWREDSTCDAWGSFCYLRDLASGECWSAAHQPTRQRGDSYEAIFSEGRVEFRRRDFGLDTHTEIVVSPEDDIELRRVRITNSSRARRHIEVTSYTEVVLAPAAADELHPAFSKLFVQTEVLAQPAALLCTRRPRSPEEPTPWLFQLMAVHGVAHEGISHETDRARFVGRGRSLESPQALRSGTPLSNSAGSVLDPVAASRCVITLEPDQTAVIDIAYGIANDRTACLALVEKYQDRRLADRVFELAWTHGQVVLRQLNASEADAQLYGRLAGMVIYSQPTLRAESGVLLRNRRSQSGLWGYAISGDLPIVLLRVGEAASLDLVRQLVQAHAWWRLKGLAVDLVIWNEERDIYRQRLQEQILGLISAGVEAHVIDRPGGIFVRQAGQISQEDRVLLQSVARVVLDDGRGTLAEQVSRKLPAERRTTSLVPSRTPRVEAVTAIGVPELQLFNGLGGFTPDGREYVILAPAGVRPPAPWVNVLANPHFGSVISEAGSAYTWCENAHELRLTPWHNDPLSDSSGEAIYLRDDETGQVWSPTSLPCPGDAPYVTRHGFGVSVFEHIEGSIESRLQVFVALDAAVKFSVLTLRNRSDRTRQLSATGYVEWVLGDLRAKAAPHVTTEVAADSGALYARNPYSNDHGDWVGFFVVDDAHRAFSTVSGDRAEFIGRNGSMRRPAALDRTRLSGRTGAALDPCAAIHVPLQLAAGQSVEIVFLLGMGRSTDEADQLVQRFHSATAAGEALDAVTRHWRHTLEAVQVHTPDAALDVLANGWLVYQTLACRLWARSGYYQSGGAFGFRDQLQDVMALVHTQPQLLREHLLLCAGRQFVEGDVQHWWHPPAGRGVRTHISDDYLWLPLALCRYVEATGDSGVLTEPAPFLEARAVNPDEDSYYDLPGRSLQTASLYQHAVRAVRHGLRYGAHGLPLMGGGDWNDGMNLVGHRGQGESVWLGFFLCEVLQQFAGLASRHGDAAFAERCNAERAQLRERLDAHGWDGAWYRRAYFDDGTPLGSAGNAQCQSDSIAQSWSVLSGAGDPARVRLAMDALQARLVHPERGLVQLLDPPFDQPVPNPGYISGYVPGVRENGGQYTHGAIWAAMAFAALGQRERAWALLDLINPVNRARDAVGVATYKVEPYVMAADVYGVAPHIGRGGWSWYTGSAGWMYRLVVESVLGLRLSTTPEGARLYLTPCLPAGWSGFTIDYRYRETPYHIEVTQGSVHDGVAGVAVDGVAQPDGAVPLVNDARAHQVTLHLLLSAA